MPSAEPSSRETSFTAEPTPCFARGSDVTIAVVDGVDVKAMPKPKTMRPPRKCQYVESAVELGHDAEACAEARETGRHDGPLPEPLDEVGRDPRHRHHDRSPSGAGTSALCSGL